MKVIIVGGVAGGATAAARIRRLDEQVEIILFERSGYISYGSEIGIFPVETENGIRVMSVNLLLENDTDPVIWREPIIGSAPKKT